MSFLGIVGSRHGTNSCGSFSREPSFSLFVTIGLTNFCSLPGTCWRSNDNSRAVLINLVPSAD